MKYIPYKHKLISITAETGTGKSGLMTYLAHLADNDKERTRLASIRVKALNKGGLSGLTLPFTLILSDFDITLKRISRHSISLDPFRMQVANEIEQHDLYCPYSVLFVDEPYKYWGNRESSKFPERVESWFFTHRHKRLSVFLSFQDKEGIDKKIRTNLHEYWHIEKQQIKYSLFKHENNAEIAKTVRSIRQVKWVVWQYKHKDYSLYLKDYEPLRWWQKFHYYWKIYNPLMLFPFIFIDYAQKVKLKAEIKQELKDRKRVVRKVFKCNYDIFKYYNSFEFEPMDYQNLYNKGIPITEHLKTVDYLKTEHSAISPDLKGFAKFGTTYRWNRPETFTKESTARKAKRRLEKETKGTSNRGAG